MWIDKIVEFVRDKFSNKGVSLTERIESREKEFNELVKKRHSINRIEKDYSWLDVVKQNQLSFADRISIFVKYQFKPVVTMAELQKKREKAEEERIKKLENKINSVFDKLKSSLEKESESEAKVLIDRVYLLISEVKTDKYKKIFKEYCEEYNNLKIELRRREFERKVQEEQKRREEEERKREEEKKRLEEEAAIKEAERIAYEEALRIKGEREARIAEARKNLYQKVTEQKPEANNILELLRFNNIECFYHFTDFRNLESIRRYGGLYSWLYCENNGIKIPKPGGDSSSRNLDVNHRLQDYVRLSFCKDHPMAFNVHHRSGANLCLLAISPKVASFKDTLFSNINAADNDEKHGGQLADLKSLVNFDAVKREYVRKDDVIFKEHQAECMVKTFLPKEFILNLDNPCEMEFK